ncbi:MAG: ankyrin repeat domain-containing protein [Spirochaetota bacterium]|nr:ankyrin repeat domain-containing protein [Spirochaetota bacterium]
MKQLFITTALLMSILAACSVSDKEFLEAAFEGKKDKVLYMIKKGANIHAKDKYGQTALYEFAGDANMVKYLLDKGADATVLTTDGRSVLHIAAFHGNVESMKLLIDNGADINAVDGKIRSSGIISDGKHVRTINEPGDTALEVAIGQGHSEAVKFLLRKGALINPERKKYGWTALHQAADGSRNDIVKLLISRGANVNAQWDEGKTPLNMASNQGIKDLLIKHGAKDIYLRLHKEFIAAVRKRDHAKVLIYIKQGVNVNTRDGYFGTALHYICGLYDAGKMAKLLIEHGADVNLRNRNGETPLIKAASSWKGGISQALLANGAEIKDRNQEGRTALHIASYNTQYEGARLFIESGADVNARDKSGQTPLHLAIKPGSIMTSKTKKGEKIYWQEECIKILLSRGARLDIKDKKGNTPMDLAKEKQVKEWLMKYAQGS